MVWKTKEDGPYQKPQHYFASSVAEWNVCTDMETLLKYMKRQKFPFTVYRVHLPIDAAYDIEYYAPKLKKEECSYVGTWEQV